MEGHCTPQGLFALCAGALQQRSASVPKLVVVWEEMQAGHGDKNEESSVPFLKKSGTDVSRCSLGISHL